MSNTTVKLQISLDKSLREAIYEYARSIGFSSVQDFTRVMYSAFVHNQLKFNISINEELSSAAKIRYKKMLAEHVADKNANKVKIYNNIETFLADL